MKRIFSILTAIVIATSLFAQTPVNGGFENWTAGTGYDNPNNWWSPNDLLVQYVVMGATVNAFSVEKSTDAHSGTYAAKVQVADIDLGGNPQVFPGILGLTDITEEEQESGIPFTQRPDSLYFWIKYDLQGGDSIVVAAMLTVWDAVGDSAKEVGSSGYIFTGSQSTYIQLALPFDYDHSDTPDSLQIAVMVGQPDNGTATVGSYAIIDDIELTGVTSVPTAPAAPSNLVATPLKTGANNGVQLAWQDNSGDETQFVLERATTVSGPFTQLGTVGANVTTYLDNTTADNTEYFYRVYAENANGSSGFSNVADATSGGTVGIEESVAASVSVYPNPSNGQFNISLPAELENSVVALFDITGKQVYSENVNSSSMNLNLNLVSGRYFVKIQNEKHTVNKSIIIE
jgi:hypothetical protein